MPEYLLTNWSSPNLESVASAVAKLLAKLGTLSGPGCLGVRFHDWSVAQRLQALPIEARFACAFKVAKPGGSLLDWIQPDCLSEIASRSDGSTVSLRRDYTAPLHGFRGERESRSILTISHTTLESAEGRSHDPSITQHLTAVAASLGIDPTQSTVFLSSSHGLPHPRAHRLNYVLGGLPIAKGAHAWREASNRLGHVPSELCFQVLGDAAIVSDIVNRPPPGATPTRFDLQDWWKDLSPYALEPAIWQPFSAGNFRACDLGILADGLTKIESCLNAERIEFGAVQWPGQPTSIRGNFLRLMKRKDRWNVMIGIDQAYADDPEDRAIRVELEPLVASVQPTKWKRVEP